MQTKHFTSHHKKIDFYQKVIRADVITPAFKVEGDDN